MSDYLPADPSALPASMIEVAEVLGMRVAIALIRNFGGQEVKFPRRPRPDHPVILALGETDGNALCDYLGGQMIYVPHARPPRSVRKDVLRMAGEGMDRGTIARMLGISQRHVRRMANRRADKRQTDLFD